MTYLRRSDGASYAADQYDPYGRTLSSAGGQASANRMRFSSKPWIQNPWDHLRIVLLSDLVIGFRRPLPSA